MSQERRKIWCCVSQVTAAQQQMRGASSAQISITLVKSRINRESVDNDHQLSSLNRGRWQKVRRNLCKDEPTMRRYTGDQQSGRRNLELRLVYWTRGCFVQVGKSNATENAGTMGILEPAKSPQEVAIREDCRRQGRCVVDSRSWSERRRKTVSPRSLVAAPYYIQV